MEGELNSIIFPQVLRVLHTGRRTGALDVAGPGGRARIFFSLGAVVFASSVAVEKRLGEVLVRMGKLSRETIDRVLGELPPGTRLGKFLLDNSYVTIGEVHAAIEEQIHSILIPIFNWDEGTYHFTDGEQVDTDEVVSNVSTADLILRGIRGMADFAPICQFLLQKNPRVTMVADPFSRYQKLTLNREEGFVFSRIAGDLTVRDICDLAPTSEEQTCRIVFGLLQAGLLEDVDLPASLAAGKAAADEPPKRPVSPPPPEVAEPSAPRLLDPDARRRVKEFLAGLSELSHYEVLGVALDASLEAINRAFQQFAALYHPDQFHDPEAKSDLEAIFARLVEAWKVLTDPTTREDYNLLMETPLASTAGGSVHRAVWEETPPSQGSPAAVSVPGSPASASDMPAARPIRGVPPVQTAPAIPPEKAQPRPGASRPSEKPSESGGVKHGDPPAATFEVEPTVQSRGKGFNAEEMSKMGRQFAFEKQYWNAIQCLRNAVTADPGNAKYHFDLAQVLSKNPKWRKEAEVAFGRAIEINPINEKFMLGLAMFYKEGGRIIQARKVFQGILKIDPSCKVAKAELEGIDPKGKKGIAGLLAAFRKKTSKQEKASTAKKENQRS